MAETKRKVKLYMLHQKDEASKWVSRVMQAYNDGDVDNAVAIVFHKDGFAEVIDSGAKDYSELLGFLELLKAFLVTNIQEQTETNV